MKAAAPTPGRIWNSEEMLSIRRLLRVYRFLMRLYPRPFRAMFGDELTGVFAESLRDARQRGRWALWTCFFREILDMVPNLLREYITNDTFNRLVERTLTHRQHSRWRQASSLGFALGFGLMELANQVGRFFPANPGVAFPATASHISVLNNPDGSLELTPFHWVGLVMLIAGGLVAGLVLNRAEKPPAVIRLPLVTAASLGGAYALLYGLNYAVWRAQFAASFGYGMLNILNPLLFGGLVAVGLGASLNKTGPGQRSTGRYLGRMFVMGSGGIFIGGLAAWVVLIALTMIDWIERSLEQLIYHLPGIPDKGLISSFFLYPVIAAVLFSAVQGWYYGAYTGEEIGARRGAPGTAPKGLPVSDGLAKVAIAVLVVIVMLSLLLLAVNTPPRG